ncbi:hypothetical protein ACIBAG_29510 [Streptomyces sp. NPDC051243]|uniref:hypothetical protein n=1 Tax=Streptomyces sp. NPDC051243 TaxID=3365646 RepID=UPI0037B7248F
MAVPPSHGPAAAPTLNAAVAKPPPSVGASDAAVGQDNGVLLSLGEAKWDQVMGVGHLERLRHAQALLTRRGVDTSAVRLACYSGAGFTDELRAKEERGEVVLVDLRRLYEGE